MNQFRTRSLLNKLFTQVPCAICVATFVSLPAFAEQIWLTQGALFHATDTLRLSLYNTIYLEHGEQFYNEVSPAFRWAFAPNWSAGAGMTFPQSRRTSEVVTDDGETVIHHHWAMGPRPSENVALEWTGKYGGWNFFDANSIYMYFRKDERDWIVYRNLFTVTAPAIPAVPCKPRPYLTQYVYFTGRDGYDGLDRFYQFRTTAGLRLRPLEILSLSAYWQYRDIERKTGDWYQVRAVGLSATLLF